MRNLDRMSTVIERQRLSLDFQLVPHDNLLASHTNGARFKVLGTG